MFEDVFGLAFVQSFPGLDAANPNHLYWRMINRASKALAATATGDGTVYVYMNGNNCRNLFSPPSQKPSDIDLNHGGVATNGEIWYYSELPTLMRNLNVKKIVTFYKTERTSSSPPHFVTTTQWDVSVVRRRHSVNLADLGTHKVLGY